MKKITALLLALMMLAGVFASCGKPKDTGKAGKLKVVTTIFPAYDWVRAILGDKAENAEITMLLDNGVDLHSYQPTADDIVKISDCDLFVYVGGESDGWVENALQNAANRNMKVINLLEVLGDSVKTEETVEGMQEDGHDHGHSHDEQLTEDDIRDRTLSDFAGAWKSLHPYLLNGDLDKFCQHRAEEDEDSSTTKDTYLEKFKASWQCDAEKISINGNTITFTYGDGKTVSAEYTYAGYQPKLDDEGKIRSVRYQFETTSADAPKYVQFNDHGHEPGEAEHFHIYFGNDGFDALMSAKTNPFFVKDALSAEDILDELMGHDHGEEKDEHVWLSLKNAQTLCVTLADARCPEAVRLLEEIQKEPENESGIENLKVAPIEPILLHCARELSTRPDLADGEKIITTPCQSLSVLGNSLGLENTRFIAWNRLAGGEVRVRAIEDSPIPPGYFAGICRKDGQAAKVESVSSPEKIRAYVESGSWKQADLLELLYCKDGCHHGDGVQTE